MKKYLIYAILTTIVFVSCSKDDSGSGGTGIAGSMARFINYQNYLYIVDENSLNLYDVTSPQNMYLIEKINLSMTNSIETIFINNGFLYIGSNDGMRIFSLENPASPKKLSVYSHIKSCDPVVANDSIAFVTLRSNSSCRMGTTVANSLDIVNIKNKYFPTLIKSMSMQNPHGMAIDSCFLFLCNAEAGLKVFNISDPRNLQIISTIYEVNPIDAIAINKSKTLLVVTSQGFKIFDYSNIYDIKYLSGI